MELAGTVFMVSHMVNRFAADFSLQDSATSKLTKMTICRQNSITFGW